MGTETQARSAGYPLMRYGLAEYNAVIDYSPNTENVKTRPETYRFIASNIMGCYVSWSRSLPSGEIRIGDKIYLSIPNGWDERLQYYPWYTGHRYWQYNQWNYPEQNYDNDSITPKGARGNEGHYNYYHGNETNLNVYRNRNRFTDKLLVCYRKVVPNGTELDPVIENPLPPVDKRVKVRLKIFVQNSDTEIFFNLRYKSASSFTFSYDFGDGSLVTYNQASPEADNTPISHIYSSAGYYIVDLILESYDNMSDSIKLECYNDLVYTNIGQTNILKCLYINSPYLLVFNEVKISNGSDIEYVYIDIPNDRCDIMVGKDVNISDLYVLVKGDDQLYAHTLLGVNSTSHIDNIHLGTKISVLDVGNCSSVICDNIYSYSLHPMRIVDYKLYDASNDVYDFSNSEYSFDFYVKPAVINESRAINVNLPISVF